jgi:hypothetical protein
LSISAILLLLSLNIFPYPTIVPQTMALGGRSAKGPVGSGSSGDAKEIMDEEVGVAKAEVDQWWECYLQ